MKFYTILEQLYEETKEVLDEIYNTWTHGGDMKPHITKYGYKTVSDAIAEKGYRALQIFKKQYPESGE